MATRSPRSDRRRFRPYHAIVLVVALVAGAAWIGRIDGGEQARGALTETELRWIDRFREWEDTRPYESRAADCERQFDDAVGDAPPTLEAAEWHARSACGDGLAAWKQMDRAWKVVEPRLRENRRLPRVDRLSRASRVDLRLSRIASRVAGNRLTVHCWARSDWDRIAREHEATTGDSWDYIGFVDASRREIHLDPDNCEPIARIAYGEAPPGYGEREYELATSVLTFAHELQHTTERFADEPEVECYALQTSLRVAVAVGLPRDRARLLVDAYWLQLYRDNAPSYRSRECKDGGELDLRDDHDWPCRGCSGTPAWDDPASLAAARAVVTAEKAYQSGFDREWGLLHPRDRAVVGDQRFGACSDAVGYDDPPAVQAVRVVDSALYRAGFAPGTPSKAVTLKIESEDGPTYATQQAVRAGDAWYWVLAEEEYLEYRRDECY